MVDPSLISSEEKPRQRTAMGCSLQVHIQDEGFPEGRPYGFNLRGVFFLKTMILGLQGEACVKVRDEGQTERYPSQRSRRFRFHLMVKMLEVPFIMVEADKCQFLAAQDHGRTLRLPSS